jgi:hypothetical protein
VEHRGHDDRVFNEPQEMEGFFEPVLQGVVDLARCGGDQRPDAAFSRLPASLAGWLSLSGGAAGML